MGLRAEDPEFSVIHGHRPRLWPGADGSGDLLALERRWQELFTGKSVSLRARDRSGRRRLEGAAAVVQTAAAVTGRVHPLQRAAAAAAQRGQHTAGFADASDALLRGVVLEGPIQHPAWHAAYESLTLAVPRLDTRLTRHFGWRLLHGSLRCRAVVAPWCTVGSMQELHDTVCCSASCCVAQLETLSHTFMGCPVVQPAVAWLGALWSKVVAGCSCLWMPGFCWLGTTLSGTLGVGMPGRHCGPICACCFGVPVWHLRCHRVATGKVFTAAAVVGLTAAWVGRAIRLDWLRVVADLTQTHSDSLPGASFTNASTCRRRTSPSGGVCSVWAMCWLKSPLMEQPYRLCVCMCLLRSLALGQCQPSLLLWRRPAAAAAAASAAPVAAL
jgi:hypothetical protein